MLPPEETEDTSFSTTDRTLAGVGNVRHEIVAMPLQVCTLLKILKCPEYGYDPLASQRRVNEIEA
jgi:hypothetical protein